MKGPKLMRLSAALQLGGLAFLLLSLINLTPGTFTAFSVLGLPLIVVGLLVYLMHVVNVLTQKGAL